MATFALRAAAGVASLPSRHAIVVSSPCLDSTTFPPVLRSMKQPWKMREQHAAPASQRWPSVAAMLVPESTRELDPLRAPSAMTPYSSRARHDAPAAGKSIGASFTAVGSCPSLGAEVRKHGPRALVASVTCVPAER